jgi:hypothetical protein
MPVVLRATAKLTVPLPVPLAPELIVIHESLLIACQPQPAGAVTLTVPSPPSAVNDCSVGKMVRGGFEVVKFTLAELFAVDGSRTGEVTAAVLPTLTPLDTEQFKLATIVIVSEPPAESVLNETIRLLPVPLQTPLPVETQDTKVSDPGKLSVTVTEAAGSGPLFTRVIVYVTLLPATIVPTKQTCNPRSAAHRSRSLRTRRISLGICGSGSY